MHGSVNLVPLSLCSPRISKYQPYNSKDDILLRSSSIYVPLQFIYCFPNILPAKGDCHYVLLSQTL